jgi:hypothetical protein
MQNPIRVALTLLCLLIASDGAYAASGTIVVRSHCPITGATGIGRGTTLGQARTAAIEACVSKGGVPVCCMKHADRI